jgi:hypothetical protein
MATNGLYLPAGDALGANAKTLQAIEQQNRPKSSRPAKSRKLADLFVSPRRRVFCRS